MTRNLRRLVKKHKKNNTEMPAFMPKLNMSRFEYERNEPTMFVGNKARNLVSTNTLEI